MSTCVAVAKIAIGCLVVAACGSRAPSATERSQPLPSQPPAASHASAGSARQLEGGVTVHERDLERSGARMTVWIYDPPASAVGRRPVILIGAAGTPLFWGMDLAMGDRPEHVPWAQRGYVVVAYSLDGHVEDRTNEPSIVAGVRAFVRANAGLDNARAALEHALASDPRADPERVYAVGHSSAGTLALRIGAELPQIKGIIAFNAVTDVEGSIAQLLPVLRAVDPNAQACLQASSPMSHVAALRRKPLFLFHSSEDDGVPAEETARLAEALKPIAAPSQVMITPTGDHYDSMLKHGIPAAITWLDAMSSALPAGRGPNAGRSER
jgi:dipeptidyl aminopeptidase/acylaminoacyl peptidase